MSISNTQQMTKCPAADIAITFAKTSTVKNFAARNTVGGATAEQNGGTTMRKTKDIMDVKHDIREGYIEVAIHGNNILLRDRYSGEAVKIGEIKKGGDNNAAD